MNNIRLRFNDRRRALRLLSRCVPLIFLAVLALTATSACFAFQVIPGADSTDKSLPRVFVLSVADYRSFTGSGLQGVKRDVARVEGFFLRNVLSDKLLEYSLVDPYEATPEATIKAIDEFQGKVGKNDVVFFYYSGHGAYDPENGGHYLELQGAKGEMQALYRSEIKRRLLALNARLVVIFTDCPNVMLPLSEGTAYVAPKNTGTQGAAYVESPKTGDQGVQAFSYSPVVEKLFVDSETRGVVDLTASVPGQFCFSYKDGSIATTTAIKTFEKLNKELEEDSSAKVDWRRFVDEWTKESEKISRERLENLVLEDSSRQEKQTPHAYELPGSVRLGARVAERMSSVAGLQITEIVKDSPAERVGLKVGDFIVRIDQRNTVKEYDYYQIVDIAPRNTTITFVRCNQNDKENYGKEQTVEIELNGTPVDESTSEGAPRFAIDGSEASASSASVQEESSESTEVESPQIGVKVWFELEDGTFVNPLERRWSPNERFYVHIEAPVPLYVSLFRIDPETDDWKLLYPSDKFENSKKVLQADRSTRLPIMFATGDDSNDETISLVAVRADLFGNCGDLTSDGSAEVTSELSDAARGTLKSLGGAAFSGKSIDSATIRKKNPETSEERAEEIADAIDKDAPVAKFQITKPTEIKDSKSAEDVCLYMLGTSQVGLWTLKLKKTKHYSYK